MVYGVQRIFMEEQWTFFFAMNTPFFAPFMKCFIDSIFLMKL